MKSLTVTFLIACAAVSVFAQRRYLVTPANQPILQMRKLLLIKKIVSWKKVRSESRVNSGATKK